MGLATLAATIVSVAILAWRYYLRRQNIVQLARDSARRMARPAHPISKRRRAGDARGSAQTNRPGRDSPALDLGSGPRSRVASLKTPASRTCSDARDQKPTHLADGSESERSAGTSARAALPRHPARTRRKIEQED